MDRLNRCAWGSIPGSQLFRGAEPIFFRRSFWAAPALPQVISECGDVPLFGFVSGFHGAMRLAGLLMRLLCLLVSHIGVFEALSGAFMPGQVIFFSVVLGAAAMSVGSKVMVLSGDLL
jgi:hypothetical protein